MGQDQQVSPKASHMASQEMLGLLRVRRAARGPEPEGREMGPPCGEGWWGRQVGLRRGPACIGAGTERGEGARWRGLTRA